MQQSSSIQSRRERRREALCQAVEAQLKEGKNPFRCKGTTAVSAVNERPVASTLTPRAKATLLRLCSKPLEAESSDAVSPIGVGRSYFNNAYYVPPPTTELDRRLTALARTIISQSSDVDGPLSGTLSPSQLRLLERAEAASRRLRSSV